MESEPVDTNAKAGNAAGGDNKEVRSKPDQEQDEAKMKPLIKKHPLLNNWSFWYLDNYINKNWEDRMYYLASMGTVEDFWNVFCHMKPPSELETAGDYFMFKTGIRPMWEVAANKGGGYWVIKLPKHTKDDLDNLWLNTLLCLIGETCTHAYEICGAGVAVRQKINKISIWTANGNNEVAIMDIGRKLREVLCLSANTKLEYYLFKDLIAKQLTETFVAANVKYFS